MNANSPILRGAAKHKDGYSPYTNTLMCATSADGSKRYPIMLYTFNQEFNINNTKVATKAHLTSAMAKYSISEDQIVVLKQPVAKKIKYYCPENAQIMTSFAKKMKFEESRRQMRYFTDKGPSMTGLKGHLGMGTHLQFEPNVHQFLSVWDNSLNGIAKEQNLKDARDKKIDPKDDVNWTFNLLSRLRDLTKEQIRAQTTRNFMLDISQPTIDDAMEVIAKSDSQWAELHKECLDAYLAQYPAELDYQPAPPQQDQSSMSMQQAT